MPCAIWWIENFPILWSLRLLFGISYAYSFKRAPMQISGGLRRSRDDLPIIGSEEVVRDSFLSSQPEEGIRTFLTFVREKIHIDEEKTDALSH